jgi:hypothetical protein
MCFWRCIRVDAVVLVGCDVRTGIELPFPRLNRAARGEEWLSRCDESKVPLAGRRLEGIEADDQCGWATPCSLVFEDGVLFEGTIASLGWSEVVRCSSFVKVGSTNVCDGTGRRRGSAGNLEREFFCGYLRGRLEDRI